MPGSQQQHGKPGSGFSPRNAPSRGAARRRRRSSTSSASPRSMDKRRRRGSTGSPRAVSPPSDESSALPLAALLEPSLPSTVASAMSSMSSVSDSEPAKLTGEPPTPPLAPRLHIPAPQPPTVQDEGSPIAELLPTSLARLLRSFMAELGLPHWTSGAAGSPPHPPSTWLWRAEFWCPNRFFADLFGDLRQTGSRGLGTSPRPLRSTPSSAQLSASDDSMGGFSPAAARPTSASSQRSDSGNGVESGDTARPLRGPRQRQGLRLASAKLGKTSRSLGVSKLTQARRLARAIAQFAPGQLVQEEGGVWLPLFNDVDLFVATCIALRVGAAQRRSERVAGDGTSPDSVQHGLTSEEAHASVPPIVHVARSRVSAAAGLGSASQHSAGSSTQRPGIDVDAAALVSRAAEAPLLQLRVRINEGNPLAPSLAHLSPAPLSHKFSSGAADTASVVATASNNTAATVASLPGGMVCLPGFTSLVPGLLGHCGQGEVSGGISDGGTPAHSSGSRASLHSRRESESGVLDSANGYDSDGSHSPLRASPLSASRSLDCTSPHSSAGSSSRDTQRQGDFTSGTGGSQFLRPPGVSGGDASLASAAASTLAAAARAASMASACDSKESTEDVHAVHLTSNPAPLPPMLKSSSVGRRGHLLEARAPHARHVGSTQLLGRSRTRLATKGEQQALIPRGNGPDVQQPESMLKLPSRQQPPPNPVATPGSPVRVPQPAAARDPAKSPSSAALVRSFSSHDHTMRLPQGTSLHARAASDAHGDLARVLTGPGGVDMDSTIESESFSDSIIPGQDGMGLSHARTGTLANLSMDGDHGLASASEVHHGRSWIQQEEGGLQQQVFTSGTVVPPRDSSFDGSEGDSRLTPNVLMVRPEYEPDAGSLMLQTQHSTSSEGDGSSTKSSPVQGSFGAGASHVRSSSGFNSFWLPGAAPVITDDSSAASSASRQGPDRPSLAPTSPVHARSSSHSSVKRFKGRMPHLSVTVEEGIVDDEVADEGTSSHSVEDDAEQAVSGARAGPPAGGAHRVRATPPQSKLVVTPPAHRDDIPHGPAFAARSPAAQGGADLTSKAVRVPTRLDTSLGAALLTSPAAVAAARPPPKRVGSMSSTVQGSVDASMSLAGELVSIADSHVGDTASPRNVQPGSGAESVLSAAVSEATTASSPLQQEAVETGSPRSHKRKRPGLAISIARGDSNRDLADLTPHEQRAVFNVSPVQKTGSEGGSDGPAVTKSGSNFSATMSLSPTSVRSRTVSGLGDGADTRGVRHLHLPPPGLVIPRAATSSLRGFNSAQAASDSSAVDTVAPMPPFDIGSDGSSHSSPPHSAHVGQGHLSEGLLKDTERVEIAAVESATPVAASAPAVAETATFPEPPQVQPQGARVEGKGRPVCAAAETASATPRQASPSSVINQPREVVLELQDPGQEKPSPSCTQAESTAPTPHCADMKRSQASRRPVSRGTFRSGEEEEVAPWQTQGDMPVPTFRGFSQTSEPLSSPSSGTTLPSWLQVSQGVETAKSQQGNGFLQTGSRGKPQGADKQRHSALRRPARTASPRARCQEDTPLQSGALQRSGVTLELGRFSSSREAVRSRQGVRRRSRSARERSRHPTPLQRALQSSDNLAPIPDQHKPRMPSTPAPLRASHWASSASTLRPSGGARLVSAPAQRSSSPRPGQNPHSGATGMSHRLQQLGGGRSGGKAPLRDEWVDVLLLSHESGGGAATRADPSEGLVSMLRPLATHSAGAVQGGADLFDNVVGGLFGTLQCRSQAALATSKELSHDASVVQHALRLGSAAKARRKAHHGTRQTLPAPLASRHGSATLDASMAALGTSSRHLPHAGIRGFSPKTGSSKSTSGAERQSTRRVRFSTNA